MQDPRDSENEQETAVEVVVVPVGLLDVEDGAVSDLNARQPTDVAESDGLALPCQICMDEAPRGELVTRLCGPECPAEVCRSCLVQHLSVSVYSFYPGMLPKVRCPVCLTLLNKCRWAKFVRPTPERTSEPTSTAKVSRTENQSPDGIDQYVEYLGDEGTAPSVPSTSDNGCHPSVDDDSHILDKYAVLCRQSCGFLSPCCHKADYTMLPPPDLDTPTIELLLTPDQTDAIPAFFDLLRAFCHHQEDTDTLYECMEGILEDDAEQVLWQLLPRIADEERRATLLLHHLFLYPNTETHCCKMEVCFKCKAANHHDGDCNDFVEADSVLQCRGCHVTLVKVDGCDSVTCLCGYSFSWNEETARQRAMRRRRGLARVIRFERALLHKVLHPGALRSDARPKRAKRVIAATASGARSALGKMRLRKRS